MNAASNELDQNFHKILRGLVFQQKRKFLNVMPDHCNFASLSQFPLDSKPIHYIDIFEGMCVITTHLGTELQFLNMALVSLRLAWNISRKIDSELLNHELLDVLSGVVVKLSGHDTWNCTNTVQTMF